MPFSSRTLDFLFENRLHDSKMWFEEHRAEYREVVLEPLSDFVTALTPTMLEMDHRLICEPKVGKSISRIYRDTRFSRDKSIFREVMWCIFIRDKKLYHGLPGFFFEVSPAGFRYGCGYYQASTQSMDAIRARILANDKGFQAARKAYEQQTVFQLEADRYKRSKYPEQSEAMRSWLDCKNLCFLRFDTDFSLLFSEELPAKIADDFRLLEPVYRFLMETEE